MAEQSPITSNSLGPITTGLLACDALKELLNTRQKMQDFVAWLVGTDGNLTTDFKNAILHQLLFDAAKKGWLVMSDETTGYPTLTERLLLNKLAGGTAVDGDTLKWDEDALGTDPNIGAWVPFHRFVSTQAVVPPPSTGGIVEVDHGLGYTPTSYMAQLVCIGADVGYAVGDIVDASGLIFYNSGAGEVQHGATVLMNASKVSCVFRNGGGTPHYQLLNKGTWDRDTIDVTKWEVRFVAD